MKKRIISILLSVSILCFSFGLGNRRASAAAAGTIAALGTIGALAFELLGVMNGNYDNTANAIGSILNGIPEGAKLTFYGDDIINPFTGEVVYHEDGLWQTGVASIASALQDMFDNGEITEVDGQIKLTYDQYKKIYDELWEIAPKPGVDFESNYSAFFIDFEGLPYQYPFPALPNASYYLNVEPGESYAACYYNDEKIVFSDYYFDFLYQPDNRQIHYLLQRAYCKNGIIREYIGGLSTSGNASFITSIFENPANCFTLNSFSSVVLSTFNGNDYNYESSNCFVFSDGTLTYTPISEVDLSDCKFGMVSTSADYAGFLSSLTGYAAVEGSDLNDLSDVLPTEYNPSLSFPTNPDLTRPLENQITVGDVPGVSDLPLSEYQAKTNTDIDVPSVIASKFPFCIPFDFMRFLGLLCSDPVAPVFRIPISTNPGNLGAWSGNQTVGEYLSPSDPMFEIDEEIVLDLSAVPLVQPICYFCFIVGFIIMLLHITPKMIQH